MAGIILTKSFVQYCMRGWLRSSQRPEPSAGHTNTPALAEKVSVASSIEHEYVCHTSFLNTGVSTESPH